MSLQRYLASRLETPFEWGAHDCVLFAAGWVRLSTGLDPLTGIPKWTTAIEAARSIELCGGLVAAIDERFKRINPKLARDGDLALFKNSVCLFSGPHIVGPAKQGLQFIRRSEAEMAWEVR